MKKMLKKLEEMLRHEIGEAASTNGNDDGDICGAGITSLFTENLLLNP
jgi:hypothetical protein